MMAGMKSGKNGVPKSLDPSLMNVLKNEKLKWVFVGGNGGTGKTTVSCSVALRLAEVRRSVLLLSTDSDQSVSHTFDQSFNRTPTKVSGVDNLFVVEIDPKRVDECLPENLFEHVDLKKILTEALDSIPGIKLALVLYAEIIKIMSNPNPEYDVIVFDTAFGGQTAVSMDCLPDALEMLFAKTVSMREGFMPVLSMFGQMQSALNQGLQDAFDRFSEVLNLLKKAKLRLRDPEETTYLAVCTPDFLSVYETEKMIQQLCERQIDCHNVVVNQNLVDCENCKLCQPRQKTQAKYTQQILDLYEDFHVVQVPLVGHEVKGSNLLKEFSNLMFK